MFFNYINKKLWHAAKMIFSYSSYQLSFSYFFFFLKYFFNFFFFILIVTNLI
uniref:Uncharacterized protein n=1 Tax=Oxytricha trifallax TaxID=1172189 RepID=G9HRD9_9SPIT|nr:hypothetical protein [Oxytricha trifallax]